ncbi:hypothetical protein ZIOFF_031947 [Zingiber officinale]|uniref:Uncharacterized protein n=1 Tax=Zingiber officinale TaxID=94328 RepID=A0A8J5GM47_ZINOF|nr:hypothetical protein ZIOFF_035534 [Zingiber officinale]KAG6506620.1 hypothetical protein ZIOFF_031947 [Zingiber officinale]
MGFFSTVLGFFGFGWGITLILVIGSTYKSSPSPPTSSREVISIWDSTESMFKSHIDAGKVPQKEDLIKPGEIAKSLELVEVLLHFSLFNEIVREEIFMQYGNEVSYACQVNVLNYISRSTSKDFIQIEIVVEKDSLKIILIGKCF